MKPIMEEPHRIRTRKLTGGRGLSASGLMGTYADG
jgi:hypothetical protein